MYDAGVMPCGAGWFPPPVRGHLSALPQGISVPMNQKTGVRAGWLLNEIALAGMRVGASLLAPRDRASNLRACHDLAEEYAHLFTKQHFPHVLRDAINHGMRNLWPYRESGDPWDAHDFRKRAEEAIAMGVKLREQGLIPLTYEETQAIINRREEELNEEG